MLSFEFKTLPTVGQLATDKKDLLAHSSAHSYYGLCEAKSAGPFCSGPSTNATLNFIGSLEVARKRYNNSSNGAFGPALDSVGANLSLASYIVDLVFSPTDPEWMFGGSGKSMFTAIDSSHPSSWGNQSLYSITISDYMWKYGTSGQDYFFVLSVSQTAALQPYKKQ